MWTSGFRLVGFCIGEIGTIGSFGSSAVQGSKLFSKTLVSSGNLGEPVKLLGTGGERDLGHYLFVKCGGAMEGAMLAYDICVLFVYMLNFAVIFAQHSYV